MGLEYPLIKQRLRNEIKNVLEEEEIYSKDEVNKQLSEISRALVAQQIIISYQNKQRSEK